MEQANRHGLCFIHQTLISQIICMIHYTNHIQTENQHHISLFIATSWREEAKSDWNGKFFQFTAWNIWRINDRHELRSEISNLTFLKSFQNFFSRIFWISLMCLAFGAFCHLLVETTEKFLSDKIILQLSKDEVSIKDIPFPAMTICPQIFEVSSFSKFDRQSFIPSNSKWVYFTFNTIQTTFRFKHSSEAFFEFSEILQNFTDTESNIIKLLNSTAQVESLLWVFWASWRVLYSTPFQMILTKWGFCFSFNMMPLPNLINMRKYFCSDLRNFFVTQFPHFQGSN